MAGLSKNVILKGNSSFTTVFKQGKVFSSQFFIAYVTQIEPFKVGFAVQKGYRNKPERNRIKRITRELFRQNICQNSLLYHMVILSKLQVLHTPFSLLETDIIQLLSKIQNYQSLDIS